MRPSRSVEWLLRPELFCKLQHNHHKLPPLTRRRSNFTSHPRDSLERWLFRMQSATFDCARKFSLSRISIERPEVNISLFLEEKDKLSSLPTSKETCRTHGASRNLFYGSCHNRECVRAHRRFRCVHKALMLCCAMRRRLPNVATSVSSPPRPRGSRESN